MPNSSIAMLYIGNNQFVDKNRLEALARIMEKFFRQK
jgi:hypothetical protein